MNKDQLNRELEELQYKALQMVERREFTSAHKLHKQIERVKKLLKEIEC